MKLRSLVVAALVLLTLIGVLYWSTHRKPSGQSSELSANTSPSILNLDQAAITNLTLKQRDAAPVTLVKEGASNWQITEPKLLGADQDTVSSMLATLSTLSSERVVEDKGADLKQYGLDPPAFELDITEKNNKTQKLLVGDDTPTGDAAYAAVVGDPRLFTTASYNKTSLDKSLNDLRDKRLLTESSENISRVELVGKSQDIEFTGKAGSWQIVKPRPLRTDSSQVDELIGKLTGARMDLSQSGGKDTAAIFAHATPVATAKVTDGAGTQTLQVRKNKDDYYAKSSIVNGVYKVDSDLGHALGQNLDAFRNKKLFDFGFDEPNKLELHSGSKAYSLSRNDDDWWSNGKKMDAESVESLVSSLRNLTATKFVDSGFTTPSVEADVTSNDGKRVEKVLISKSGKGYIAKRENEPSLYQLDSSTVDDLQKTADEIKPAAAPGK